MGRKPGEFINQKIKAVDQAFEKWIGMSPLKDLESEKKSDLGYLRNEAFYKIAFLFAIFGFVPIMLGAYIFSREGVLLFAILQVLVYAGIVLLTLSNRVRNVTKRIAFIGGYYCLSLLLLIAAGSNGAGFVLIISILAIAGVALNKEQSAGFLICNIITFFVLSVLLYLGVLDNFAISAYKPSWMIMVITSQVTGIVLLMIVRSIYNDLEKKAETLKASKEIIAKSEKHYRDLFDYSGVGISYYTPEGLVVSLNKLAASMLEGSPEDFKGKSLYDFFPKEGADRYMQRIAKTIAGEQPQRYEDRAMSDAGERWLANTFSKIEDINGSVAGVQVASLDISESKRLEKDLIHSSNHDFLTDLYNRGFFERQLRITDRQENLPLTIILSDINGLKLINDSFGHKAGDRLLIEAARFIMKGCSENAVAARIGGGEFAILMPRTNRQKAEETIRKITEEIQREAVENSMLSVSFGHATKETMSEDVNEVFVEAENQMYKQKIYESSSMRSKAIDVIMNSLYEKSQRELYHSKRVGWLCAQTATHMGFAQERVKRLQLAGLVHDIGKIGVEEKILNKAGKLDHEEWEEMKKHPEAGWRILSSVCEFSEIADFILAHHECWDGGGYPNGLKGEQIPLEARIIAVADAYDAMTSKRSYREPMEMEAAVAEIKAHAGNQFDPAIAEVFLEHLTTHGSELNSADANNDLFIS